MQPLERTGTARAEDALETESEQPRDSKGPRSVALRLGWLLSCDRYINRFSRL